MSAKKRVKKELEIAVTRQVEAFLAKEIPTRLSMTTGEEGVAYRAWEIPGLVYDEKASYVLDNGKVYAFFENKGFVRTSFWFITFSQPIDRSGYYACGTDSEAEVPLSVKDWRTLLRNIREMNEQATA